jgi:hypothetical protein
MTYSAVLTTALAAIGSLIFTPLASAAPAVNHPYSLSVFAKSANGYSQPDSIERWNNSILIGFQNHVAKDGTDGKSSTIVQYSLQDGHVERTFSVPGHNDGLRLVGENDLWCLQNEDANPNLVVIDLESQQQKLYKFAPPVHQGGFDDMVVIDGQVYMTASNPSADPNIYPALVRAILSGNMVAVVPVLYGNANAIDIPTGSPVTLNLQDPDSMTIDPRGNIVLDSQADSELIFIKNVASNQKLVGRLSLTAAGFPGVTVDDTAFAPGPNSFLLVTDVAGDTVYRIDNKQFGFEPGAAYSASDTAGFVASLNLDTGLLTPIATGFGSARGLLFVKAGDSEGQTEQ